MNASQIHLALNHVPLFFSIIGGCVLIYGFIRKNESIKILSLYFMIAAALFTIPVYLTGEGTEEIVEKLPGVSEGMIEEHEEMAKIGLIIIIFTGVSALGALLLKKKESLLRPALIMLEMNTPSKVLSQDLSRTRAVARPIPIANERILFLVASSEATTRLSSLVSRFQMEYLASRTFSRSSINRSFEAPRSLGMDPCTARLASQICFQVAVACL